MTKINPWARLLARSIDVFIFSSLVVICWKILFPENYSALVRVLLIITILFSWIFVEAFLLHFLGTTFGKWFLNIKIAYSQDEKLPFWIALKRSFLVWFKCLAMGLPIISIFTFLFSYLMLKRKGISSWDKSCQTEVSRSKIGFIRLMFSAIFVPAIIYVAISDTPVIPLSGTDLFDSAMLIVGSLTNDPD